MFEYAVKVTRVRKVTESTEVEIESETKLTKAEIFEGAEKEVQNDPEEYLMNGWERDDASEIEVIDCEITQGEEDVLVTEAAL